MRNIDRPGQAVPLADPRQQAVFRQPATIVEAKEEAVVNELAAALRDAGATELAVHEVDRRYRDYAERSRDWRRLATQMEDMSKNADGLADSVRDFHAVCTRMGVKVKDHEIRDRDGLMKLYKRSVKVSEKSKAGHLTGPFAYLVAVGIKTYLLLPLAQSLLGPLARELNLPAFLLILSITLAAILASGFTFLARFITARMVSLKRTGRSETLQLADTFLPRGVRIAYLVFGCVALVGAIIAYTVIDAAGLSRRLLGSPELKPVLTWIAFGINCLFAGMLLTYELGSATKSMRTLEAENEFDGSELAAAYRKAYTRMKDEEDLAKLRTLVLDEEDYFAAMFHQLETVLKAELMKQRGSAYRRLMALIYGDRRLARSAYYGR